MPISKYYLCELIEQGNLAEFKSVVEKEPGVINQKIAMQVPGCGDNYVNPLTHAIWHNSNEIAEYLISKGVESNDSNVEDEPTPMFAAIAKCNLKIIELLITNGESIEFLYSIAGSESLNDVFNAGNLSTLKLLANNGFSVNTYETTLEKSIIVQALQHFPTTCNDQAMLQWLYDNGSNIDGPKFDGAPLYSMILNSKYHEAALDLIKRDAKLSLIDRFIQPLAHLIALCEELNQDLLKIILQETFDIDALDPWGNSALHKAVEMGNLNAIDRLLTNGLNINIKSIKGEKSRWNGIEDEFPYGDTALILAIKNTDIDSIETLLKFKPDVNIADAKNNTALDIALKQPKFKKIISLLLAQGAKTYAELNVSGQTKQHSIEMIKGSIELGEPWANIALLQILEFPESTLPAWNNLIRHCLDYSASKPSKKWFQLAETYTREIGDDVMYQKLLSWFPLVKEVRQNSASRELKSGTRFEYVDDDAYFIAENNIRLLQGFIWIASRYDDKEMATQLRIFADAMLQKIPVVGLRSGKLATACLTSLATMQQFGINEIFTLKSITQYEPALKPINLALKALVKEKGKSIAELEKVYYRIE